jgi:hypothetical protein
VAKDDTPDAPSEDYQFEVPDFDEEAFIHKEMTSFKTTAVLFGWGILAALVSLAIFAAMGGAKTAWYLGLGVLLLFLYSLRLLYPKLNIDVAHFKRREWMGTGFLLFFTWLAFFILFANPPISDFADPHAVVFETPGVQMVGGDITLDLFASDNGEINNLEFTLTQGSTQIADENDLVHLGSDRYQYTLLGASGGSYDYSFTATDAKGNSATVTGTASVAQKAILVKLPADGKLELGQDLLVETAMAPCEGDQNRDGGECLRTVYADIGEGIALTYDELAGAWRATSNFAGWEQGNNQFNIIAATQTQFHGANTILGTEIMVGPFNMTVSGSGDIVQEAPLPASVPPAYRQTPGFGLPIMVVGLVVAVAVIRRK